MITLKEIGRRAYNVLSVVVLTTVACTVMVYDAARGDDSFTTAWKVASFFNSNENDDSTEEES